jgi:hypothetical protein
MANEDRIHLNFESVAREKFAFLNGLGFLEVEASPTLIRYRKGDVEVDVYHGRQSYEIAAGISYLGVRYQFSDFIRAVDPIFAKQYRHAQASTVDGVFSGLEDLSTLMQRYGNKAFQGDPTFYSELEKKHQVWLDEYWLDQLAHQLRPKAEAAFHQGDYASAVELYSRIQARLSPAEIKKLALAERRCKRD